jgi:hypothetical protein
MSKSRSVTNDFNFRWQIIPQGGNLYKGKFQKLVGSGKGDLDIVFISQNIDTSRFESVSIPCPG